METSSLFDAELFRWIGIPVLIFFARVVDVSLGTLRIIYISRGMKGAGTSLRFLRNSYLADCHRADHAEPDQHLLLPRLCIRVCVG